MKKRLQIPLPTQRSINRFSKYVDTSGGIWKCWDWQGTKNEKGFGSFRFERYMVAAHRVSYEWVFGPIPGLVLFHRCDNNSCVNPWHLEPVTERESQSRHWDEEKTTSDYTGVYWNNKDLRWQAQIKIESKRTKYLGQFHEEVEAAHAYDRALESIGQPRRNFR